MESDVDNTISEAHELINTDAPLNDGKFHIFGLYWTPNRIEWYLDGEKVSFQARK